MIQAKFEATKKQMEAQEMEVMEARLMKTSELNGELADDDDAGSLTWLKPRELSTVASLHAHHS